jgi:hypothetical protein
VGVENAKKAYELRKCYNEMKSVMFKYQFDVLSKQMEWMMGETVVNTASQEKNNCKASKTNNVKKNSNCAC